MNAILPGTIEESGLDKYKVGTLEAPSGGAWFALEAVLFTQHWLDGRGEPSPHWLRAQELNVINAAAARRTNLWAQTRMALFVPFKGNLPHGRSIQ